MDRGFKVYMKEGLQQAKKTIKGRKVTKYKYVFMLVASFLSKLFILPAPLFIHSRIRLANLAREKNVYEITHSFEDADNPKCYWATIVSMAFKAVLLISGLLFIGAITFGLYFVGSLFATLTGFQLLSILFAVPGAIALLVFLIAFSLNFKPVYYYLNTNNDINVGKAFGASTRSMKEQGKRTLFNINLFFYFILVLYLGVAGFVVYYLMSNPSDSIKVIAYIALIVFAIFFILFIPKLGIARDIAILALMKDIMIDPEEADDVSLVKEKMLRQGLSKDEFLVSLFDKKIENAEETTDGASEAPAEQTEENK